MRRVLPCLALVTACAAAPCLDAPPTGACFAAGQATQITLGFHPAAALTIDLDRDGHLDLVTAHATYQSFGAAWGPDHAAQTTWSIGQELAGLVIADLDRDGHLDLATGLPAADAVLVSFGAPGRARDELREYPTGESPRALAFAELDGPALVTANLGDGTVSVLRFTGRDVVTDDHRAGPGPTALALTDLDADGRLDILVTLADVDEVALLRNTGGDFARPITWPTGQQPVAVAAVDAAEFAVAGALSGDITIHAADGTIQRTWPIDAPRTLTRYGARLAALTATTAAVLDPRTGETASIALRDETDVLLGDPLAYVTRAGTRVDLAVADGPRLAAQWHHAQDIVIFAAAAADLDGDGLVDLAVRPSDTRLDLRLADPTGLGPVRSLAMPDDFDIQAILPADLDGDGSAALLLIAPGEPTRLVVLAPDGAGDFLPYSAPIELADAEPTHLLIADFDADTRDDLLVVGATPHIFHGDGTTLAAPIAQDPFTGRPLGVADVDGNSVLDLLVASEVDATAQLDVLLNPLGVPVSTALAEPLGDLRDVATGDLDGDAHLDAILCREAALAYGRGRGEGSFEVTTFTPQRSCDQVRLHDLDGDGDLDVLATSRTGTAVDAWLADAGTFTLLTRQPAAEDAVFITTPAGPALFAHDYIDARLWLPTWGPVLAEVGESTSLPQLRSARFGDLDADAAADLVALADHHLLISAVGDPTVHSRDLTATLGSAHAEHLLLIDLDADARDDIVLVTLDPDDLATVVRVDADDLRATLLATLPAVPDDVLAGDLDADGRADLVIGHLLHDVPHVTSLRSHAGALIADPAQILGDSLSAPMTPVALADLDGDRRLDLWLIDTSTEILHVARRDREQPRFLAPQRWGGPEDPRRIHLFDFTGDAHLDLVTVHDGAILLFPGGPDAQSGAPRRLASASELEGLGAAWLPGDARPVLVATRDGDPATAPLTIGRATDAGYAFNARRIPRLERTTQILQPRPDADLVVVGPHGYTLVEAVP